MVELLDDEHLVQILDVLSTDWDNTNTTYSADPRMHTGWWDWARDEPAVTVTNADVNPSAATESGISHITGDGRVGQRMAGVCLINCWGGTFETAALAGEASDGGRLSPKIAAWDFCKEARRILLANAQGTTDDTGAPALLYLTPGRHRRLIETDEDDEYPTLFRYELECRFGYIEES